MFRNAEEANDVFVRVVRELEGRLHEAFIFQHLRGQVQQARET